MVRLGLIQFDLIDMSASTYSLIGLVWFDYVWSWAQIKQEQSKADIGNSNIFNEVLLHPSPYILHPAPLHPTPYTLHPAPFTLHPVYLVSTIRRSRTPFLSKVDGSVPHNQHVDLRKVGIANSSHFNEVSHHSVWSHQFFFSFFITLKPRVE